MRWPYHGQKAELMDTVNFSQRDSPWLINETIAAEYFPLTKNQVLEKGYAWKEKEPRNYQIDIKCSDIRKT